jgi:DivIVA domain-containing protein
MVEDMSERPPVDEQVTTLRGLGRFPRGSESFVRRVSDPSFPAAMRGYDRAAVDAYVEEVSRIVAELEARQSSEAVIKRALEDVGEQTSAILQKAHETAEEVTRRSRAQADDRLENASREADRLRRGADQWLHSIQAEVETLFAERRRVIEDMRLLAEELLGVADAGLDRLEEDEAAAHAGDEDETVDASAAEDAPDTLGDDDATPLLEAVPDEAHDEPPGAADDGPEPQTR